MALNKQPDLYQKFFEVSPHYEEQSAGYRATTQKNRRPLFSIHGAFSVKVSGHLKKQNKNDSPVHSHGGVKCVECPLSDAELNEAFFLISSMAACVRLFTCSGCFRIRITCHNSMAPGHWLKCQAAIRSADTRSRMPHYCDLGRGADICSIGFLTVLIISVLLLMSSHYQ